MRMERGWNADGTPGVANCKMELDVKRATRGLAFPYPYKTPSAPAARIPLQKTRPGIDQDCTD